MGNEEWVIALYGRRPVFRKRGAPFILHPSPFTLHPLPFTHRPICLAQSCAIIPRPDEISWLVPCASPDARLGIRLSGPALATGIRVTNEFRTVLTFCVAGLRQGGDDRSSTGRQRRRHWTARGANLVLFGFRASSARTLTKWSFRWAGRITPCRHGGSHPS